MSSVPSPGKKERILPFRPIPLCITLLVGFAIAFCPVPEGLSRDAWTIFAIFVATILGIILKAYPMGVLALTSLTVVTLFDLLPFETAFSEFSRSSVWLVVFAFFIARAIGKTGLGTRVAYGFVALLGKSTLGLGYGLALTDLLLAPFVPSVTARSAGVVLPIIKSLAASYDSHPNSESSKRIGSYLVFLGFQACVITSAMFLTAMAANPMIASISASLGYPISWGLWAEAAIVPGLMSLLLLPLLLYVISPPEIKSTPEAPATARKKLQELGPLGTHEKIMLVVFLGLIVLWVFGPNFGIKAATATLAGITTLLLLGVISWSDVTNDSEAWGTFIWYPTLIMLAGALGTMGVTEWSSQLAAQWVGDFPMRWAFIALILIYFFSHYFFASATAHVGAMYGTFLLVLIQLGAPIGLCALSLAFVSNLYGGLTHYSLTPAPIFFGVGYMGLKTWWQLGFVVAIFNLFIWLVVGGLWWKFLGVW